MIETLEEIIIIAGVIGVGALWAFAAVGMVQIGWKSGVDPLVEWLKRRR
tara:strand:- start:1034 stop:1180 length:147 start_codon:yes stop_codon:yes gene_type:complete